MNIADDVAQTYADANRYRWLLAKLEEAYEGSVELDGDVVSLYCSMAFQHKGSRRVMAEIHWTDKADGPPNLSAAIDTIRLGEE